MNDDRAAKRRYSHVVIIGIDGMGAFCVNTPTPRLDGIFENGARTLSALSLFPTISAQNWGGMLTGADPEVHGLTNAVVARQEYKNETLPTIFATVRRAYPDSVLCSVSNWDCINRGIIEHDTGVFTQTADNGERTTDKAVETVLTKRPDLLFIQLDDPDEAGHRSGYGSEDHLESIRRVDKMAGRIYDAYKTAGIADDTLFISVTDHGGFKRGHGGYTDGEKYVFFALAGKTVRRTEGFFAKTKDIDAIVRYAFGIEIPAPDLCGYSSQVPDGVFTDYDVAYISDGHGVRCDVETRPQPDIGATDGLLAFFDRDEIQLAMFFEYGPEDAMGRAKFREYGRVKYYSGGVRGACAELGATGCLVSGDVKFGTDDFTVCAWLRVDDAPDAEAYYCGNKTMTDSGPGFMLGFTSVATLLGVETPDPASYEEHHVGYFREVNGGWLHVIYVFRRKECRIDLYRNFELKHTVTLPEIFRDIPLDALPFTVGDDASRGINTGNDAVFRMDDLLIFGKAFSQTDVDRLRKYYGFTGTAMLST